MSRYVRYIETVEEARTLKSRNPGWSTDGEGWWWVDKGKGGIGFGMTYKQALKEQKRMDRQAKVKIL
jgi:hypothetical protein